MSNVKEEMARELDRLKRSGYDKDLYIEFVKKDGTLRRMVFVFDAKSYINAFLASGELGLMTVLDKEVNEHRSVRLASLFRLRTADREFKDEVIS